MTSSAVLSSLLSLAAVGGVVFWKLLNAFSLDRPKKPFESLRVAAVNAGVDWLASEAKLKLESTLNGESLVVDSLDLASDAKLMPLSRSGAASALLLNGDADGLAKLNFELKLFVLEPKMEEPDKWEISVQTFVAFESTARVLPPKMLCSLDVELGLAASFESSTFDGWATNKKFKNSNFSLRTRDKRNSPNENELVAAGAVLLVSGAVVFIISVNENVFATLLSVVLTGFAPNVAVNDVAG